MRISHGTRFSETHTFNGYGYATSHILSNLRKLGHEVTQNDASADVEIWFDQPIHWKFSDGPYRIGYHPWESTALLPGWADIMNECDEIWTPSPVVADWYKTFCGIKVPVYVYEHGVEPMWFPVYRVIEDRFKVLHQGGEANRKGGRDIMQAMRLAFPDNEDVELTMKAQFEGWYMQGWGRVKIINGPVPLKDLLRIYQEHHVFAYPSYGEGFGLTPLQAMATAMPTITVPAWAPYADFLDPNLTLRSEFIDSPWPKIHPGKVLKPNMDDIVDALRFSYENFDVVRKFARNNVEQLLARYNWLTLTRNAFENLEKRL